MVLSRASPAVVNGWRLTVEVVSVDCRLTESFLLSVCAYTPRLDAQSNVRWMVLSEGRKGLICNNVQSGSRTGGGAEQVARHQPPLVEASTTRSKQRQKRVVIFARPRAWASDDRFQNTSQNYKIGSTRELVRNAKQKITVGCRTNAAERLTVTVPSVSDGLRLTQVCHLSHYNSTLFLLPAATETLRFTKCCCDNIDQPPAVGRCLRPSLCLPQFVRI